MRKIMIGKCAVKTSSTNSRIKYFILFVLSVIAVCGIGLGLFYVIDISNYKYPGSKIIKLEPYIDFDSTSRHYCDTYYVLINLRWVATDLPEKGDEIRSFLDRKFTLISNDSYFLDNDPAYLIVNYFKPLPKYRSFFINVSKVYFGGGTDKYGPITYVYVVDSRIYVGIFPRINNSCPNHDSIGQ